MNIVEWAVNRIKTLGARFSYAATKAFGTMYYGTIVSFTYLNFKHDPTPNILVMYSGMRYTHGINLNYLSIADKQWIGNVIYMIKANNQMVDGRTLYLMMKAQRPSITKTAYRMYKTPYVANARMVCAGFTPMEKLEHETNDPFIQSLKAYLNPSSVVRRKEQQNYDSAELQERIIIAQQSTPLTSATTSATRAIGSATE